MPYSDEVILQRLTQKIGTGYFTNREIIWERQADKFVSSIYMTESDMEAGPSIYLEGHKLDLVAQPGGYGLSIPRDLANKIFEEMDAPVIAPGPVLFNYAADDIDLDDDDLENAPINQIQDENQDILPLELPDEEEELEPDQNEEQPSSRRPRNE